MGGSDHSRQTPHLYLLHIRGMHLPWMFLGSVKRLIDITAVSAAACASAVRACTANPALASDRRPCRLCCSQGDGSPPLTHHYRHLVGGALSAGAQNLGMLVAGRILLGALIQGNRAAGGSCVREQGKEPPVRVLCGWRCRCRAAADKPLCPCLLACATTQALASALPTSRSQSTSRRWWVDTKALWCRAVDMS